jgi:hypothetical protein
MNSVADPGELRTATAAACPGRTAQLVEDRVRHLLGEHSWAPPADITTAESALLDVVEVFVADVHAVSDDAVAGLSPYYSPADIVAVLLHAGLCDGFTKRAIIDRSRQEVPR